MEDGTWEGEDRSWRIKLRRLEGRSAEASIAKVTPVATGV